MIWVYAGIRAIGVAAIVSLAAGLTRYVRRKRAVPDVPQAPETTVRCHTATGINNPLCENTEELNVAEQKDDSSEIYDDLSFAPERGDAGDTLTVVTFLTEQKEGSPKIQDDGNTGAAHPDAEERLTVETCLTEHGEDSSEIYDDVNTPPAHAGNVCDLYAKAHREVKPIEEDIYEDPTLFEASGPREPVIPNIYTKT